MTDWRQHAMHILFWGRFVDLWLLATVMIVVRMLLKWAATWIESMEPASALRLRVAWFAAMMPGIAFLAAAPEMIHSFRVREMGSPVCIAHCVGLMALVTGVVGTAIWQVWNRSRGAAELLRIAHPPSERLTHFAIEMGIVTTELSTDIPICSVAGIFRSRVLISTGALRRLSDEELRAALAHERAHLRRRETLCELVAAFLNTCTLVPVPDALRMYRRSREFAADHEAAREVQGITLASVLVTFARFQLADVPVQLAGKSDLPDRVALLLHGAEPNPTRRRAGFVALALIGVVAITVMLPAVSHAVRQIMCGVQM